jgi:hypothetical protein
MKTLITSSKNILGLIFIAFQFNSMHFKAQESQSVKVIVHLLDSVEAEGIPFANIVLYDENGARVNTATTNMDGDAQFKDLKPAEYKVRGIYIGYEAREVKVDLRGQGRLVEVKILLDASAGSIYCYTEFCGCTGQIVDREDYQQISDNEESETDEGMGLSDDDELIADLNDFICFPNPVKDDLHIKIGGDYATEMLMLDQTGKILEKIDLTEWWDFDLDMRKYPAGIYFFMCGGEGKTSTAKIVVKED